MSHILLFDSNDATRTKIASDLNSHATTNIIEVSTLEQVREALEQQRCSVLFFQLPQTEHENLDFFIELNKQQTPIVTVLLVPEDTSISTKTILQSGAHFFLHAPYTEHEIAQISQRALKQHLTQELTAPQKHRENGFSNIIGQSESMCQLFNLIKRLGDDGDSTILIQGESGTGKELVAKALHTHSPRQQYNFVPLNCAAIPEELLESELFGYEKGAFTGAINNKKGRIQHAHGGTLFLDEIGDMKPSLQAKLLRVIQEKEFEPVGSIKSIKVDVRIVAATHRNLDEAVANGNFREDLYYRLNVIPLHIPPLRQRSGDVNLLLDTFTQRFCTNKRRNVFTYSDQALVYLTRYPWPGNVRELENLVQRLSILHMGEIVHPKDLPEKYLYHQKEDNTAGLISDGGATDFNSRVSEFEDRLILQALVQAGGNKKEAAELLNLKRTTLLEKIKKKQLDKALTDLD